jgi:hypothetical protein
MARIVKEFDTVKKLPFWYLEFDGDRYGPFSTRQDADDYQDKEFGPEDRDDEMLVGPAKLDR